MNKPTEYIKREDALARKFEAFVLGNDYEVVIADEIAAIPAADVVEVVRCKDCTNHITKPLMETSREVCRKHRCDVTLDHFCADGIRTDGDAHD